MSEGGSLSRSLAYVGHGSKIRAVCTAACVIRLTLAERATERVGGGAGAPPLREVIVEAFFPGCIGCAL